MTHYRWVKRPWHDIIGGLLLAGCAVVLLIAVLSL